LWVRELTVGHVDRFLTAMAPEHPLRARRAKIVLALVFDLAVRHDAVDHVPDLPPAVTSDGSAPVAAAALARMLRSARCSTFFDGCWPMTSRSRSSENRRMIRSFSRLVPPFKTISSGCAVVIERSASQTQDECAALYVRDAEGHRRRATITNTANIYRLHILPVFGSRAPASITHAEVNLFLRALVPVATPLRGVARVSISPDPVRKALAAVLTTAKAYGCLTGELATKGAYISPKRRVLPTALPPETVLAVEAAFEAQRGHLSLYSRDGALLPDVFTILMATGIRVGELCALAEDAWSEGFLTVNASMTRVGTSRVGGESYARGETKTAASHRIIAVTGDAAAVLTRRKLAARKSGPLLPAENGGFLSPANLRRRWRDALARKRRRSPA